MGPSSNWPGVLIRREKRESSPSRCTEERPGEHTAGRRLGGCLHPRAGVLTRTRPGWNPDLDLAGFRTVRK